MKRLVTCGFALIALAASVLQAPSAAEAGKRRILTAEEFADTVVGGKYGDKHGFFVIHADGTFTGQHKGKEVTGTWAWEGEYLCRSGKVGKKKIPADCQAIIVEGDTMTGHRKKGKGKRVTYRLMAPES